MKAALLSSAPGRVEVVDDVSVDTPRAREVRIRTVAAGVCHSDLHFVLGHFRTRLPTVIGHEASGVVTDVGDDVSYVKPGDHVVTCLSVFCGACEFCLSGNPVLCSKRPTRRPRGEPSRLRHGDEDIHQFLDVSGFAEEMLVHENAVAKIDPAVPLDRAALIGCSVTTGLGAVFRSAKIEPGSTVAVIGCGGVGLNAVQGARLAGAGRVIAIDRLPGKLDLARQFGATDTVDAAAGDPVEQVRELSGGGVHYSFEAIGLKPTTEQAFAMLRPGGIATVIGMIPPGVSIELPGVAFMEEKKIQGSLMGSNQFRVDMPRYADLYLQGRLMLDELVSARIPLEQVNDAFDRMSGGEVARSVITFDAGAEA